VPLLPPCWACSILNLLSSDVLEDAIRRIRAEGLEKLSILHNAQKQRGLHQGLLMMWVRFLILAGDSIAVWLRLHDDEAKGKILQSSSST
jgi:hypothetical protein